MTSGAIALTLRPARPGDRDRVAEIVAATDAFRPQELAIALEVFDSAIARPGADYHAVALAGEDDRLVGFACYGPTPGTESTWDLYWIAVDPAAHRHGAGRTLMKASEDAIAAAGGRLIVVETSSRADYAATRAFYEALGYAPSARIAEFYAPQDDLIVYTRRLVPPEREPSHG